MSASAAADVVTSAADAVAVAQRLSARFAAGASARDAGRELPSDEVRTTLTESQSGDYTLTGRKSYSTGALFADWVIVRASVADDSGAAPASRTTKALAFVPRDAAGLQVVDDWDGMGQRTTASGTVTLDDVDVPAAGAQAEGVRQAAKARPHFEAHVESATEDPTVVQLAGELLVTVRGAQTLLAEAARQVESARAEPTTNATAAASVAVAVAKVAAVRASLEASSVLFELCGTRSASARGNLSRYWRDARTHTPHDATRWKVQHIGRYALSGTRPPRHGQI